MRSRRVTFAESEALIQGLSWDASLSGLSWDSEHRGLSWDSSVEDAPGRSPTRGLSWDASVEIAELLQTLRAEAVVPVSETQVERLTRVAVTELRDAPAGLTPLRPSRWALVRRRVATVGTSLALLFGGSAGVAFAADQAIPGDQLYGLDQAMERIGIGVGGSAERLGEALELVQRGDAAEGLRHAAENVIEVAADPNAADALSAAAERLLDDRGNPSDEVRASVAELLQYLADNQGEVDGQVVSEFAKEIGNAPETPPGQSDDFVPPGQSDDFVPPGQSEDPPGQGGPPDEPPGQGGPPDEPPGQGGPPDEPPGQGGGPPAEPPGQGGPPEDPPGQGNPPSSPPGQGADN